MNSLFGNWTSSLKKRFLLLVLSMLLPTFGISNTVIAADKIYASYSILEIPIPVISLENFTKTGKLDQDLVVYQDYISPQQLQKFREILLRSIKITPAVATQFLSTEQGEFFLHRLATLINHQFYDRELAINYLRHAFIAAAQTEEGITILNIIRNYPSNNIHFNLKNLLEIGEELESIISETNQAINIVQQLSKQEAAGYTTVSLLSLPDENKSVNLSFKKYTVNLFDSKRNRSLPTDIYLPNVQYPTPVIIISHGLGLNSSNFNYLAQTFSSQGLTVVIPNHPQLLITNSNNGKMQEAQEFINRPLDIKYILNQLDKYNQSHPNFQGKLNLDRVGVIGQSFGGYTALALAGAKINFRQLEIDCHPEKLKNSWNMSLLFQCRALELLPKSSRESNSYLSVNLEDERVKAAIAINPVTSSIFGKTGLNQIKTPVMFISSSKDTVAPALYEQIIPFSWLDNPHKYLVMLVGGTHFSTIGNSKPGSQQISLPANMVGNSAQARAYINNFSLPFLQTYVSQKPEYMSYLNAGYAETIADPSLGLSFLQSLKSPQLEAILEKDRKKNSIFPLLNY